MAPKNKKPPNAYWIFVQENKEQLFKTCGTNSLMQVGGEASLQWKALSENGGQAPYKKKHDELLAEYNKQMGIAETAPKETKKAPAKKRKKPESDHEEADDPDESPEKKQKKIVKRLNPKAAGHIRKLQYLLTIEASGRGGFRPVLEKFDKDNNGTLDKAEFTDLVRNGISIPKSQLSDQDLTDLMEALDDDASGTLDVGEIADFIDRGEETFFCGPVESHGPDADVSSAVAA